MEADPRPPCKPSRYLKQGYAKYGIDRSYIDSCLKEASLKAEIRPARWQQNDQLNRGSVMVVPLVYNDKIYGYCYLGNSQIYKLFDVRSIETVTPITTQAAITLQNIQLTEELKVQHEQVLELNQTLEARVDEQTRDIRSIMEHIPIGIFAIQGSELRIHKDHSQYLKRLFGVDELEGQAALPLLFAQSQLSDDEQSQALHALGSMVGEDSVNFAFNEHALPRQLNRRLANGETQQLELLWNPIADAKDQIDKVLVTLSDVTEMRYLQDTAREKAIELQIISEILSIKEDTFRKFMRSALQFHEQNRAIALSRDNGGSDELKTLQMNLHTTKGAARTLGLRGIAEVYHHLEQELGQGSLNSHTLSFILDKEHKILQDYGSMAKEKLGRIDGEVLTLQLATADVAKAFEELRAFQTETHNAYSSRLTFSLSLLQKYLYKPLSEILDDVFQAVAPLSRDLNKALPTLDFKIPPVGVAHHAEDLIRNTFVHLLRNSMDHGLEGADERVKHGKSPNGVLQLQAYFDGSIFSLVFQDDGRGLNLKRLHEMGRARGLITEEATAEAIAELAFESGLSTAQHVSQISGRGVGMGAVRKYLQDAQGHIKIVLHDHRPADEGFKPFAFLIELPATMFMESAAPPPSQARIKRGMAS
ncbi:MAG TPA: Hpt domain-containing protein [Oligoflexus sp.]|uniref:Hpt domain-containing protein n=1 Tax=Oligoflexus sp. TaxID=1971216 RepID=UPI002D233D1C|nr:Hpt domain-containing protein [Oligoflexus sp.]HYX34535.1 Hpt domain-containing protein [Oligoflexus sp.]